MFYCNEIVELGRLNPRKPPVYRNALSEGISAESVERYRTGVPYDVLGCMECRVAPSNAKQYLTEVAVGCGTK